MHKKTNKDVFLICQINFINEWYDEEYSGPDKETMREYHIKTMEYVYEPKLFITPGHPTKDEKEEFLDEVEKVVRKTAEKHFADHDMMKNVKTLIL